MKEKGWGGKGEPTGCSGEWPMGRTPSPSTNMARGCVSSWEEDRAVCWGLATRAEHSEKPDDIMAQRDGLAVRRGGVGWGWGWGVVDCTDSSCLK